MGNGELEDFEQAEGNAKSAYEKAAGMKYRWAEGEAADFIQFRQAMGSVYWRGDYGCSCLEF